MTIIAIDIQPQYRFSCMAANEQRFLQRPESIVDGLNRQAEYADKRLLVENVSADQDALCNLCNNSMAEQGGFILNRSAYFGACANGCRSKFLLSGLPHPADYDHAVEIDGDYRHGVCFHDKKETRSTGLIEWLHYRKADTLIVGSNCKTVDMVQQRHPHHRQPVRLLRLFARKHHTDRLQPEGNGHFRRNRCKSHSRPPRRNSFSTYV